MNMQASQLNELASEGERLCKSGDCINGIKYFEAALKVYNELAATNSTIAQTLSSTSGYSSSSNSSFNRDGEQIKLLQTLSIIYNQMGNAHFYLQDYETALKYHKKDLELSEKFNDESGKAKACGNIGNTLQLLGDYDEAIFYSIRNLEISTQLNDLTGEARALYNLGNIYQSKGKHMGRITYHTDSQDSERTDIPCEVKEVLMKAIYYYQKTLEIVSNKDRAAEGRTYGNLGNTYYLLGDFDAAIECHNQRLKIAKEYGDRPAERRAYSNLGNAHIFKGRFNEAADYYLKAMNVARLIGDKAIEAQSYFSLGNAYTLLQDYTIAIDFHLRHLQIAVLLDDKIGESRAYWSLGNAYAALNDLDNAILYANKHLTLARLIGDTTSELTAKMNLYDFQNMLTCSSVVRDNESALFTPMSSQYNSRISLVKKSNSIDSIFRATSNTEYEMNINSRPSSNQQQHQPIQSILKRPESQYNLSSANFQSNENKNPVTNNAPVLNKDNVNNKSESSDEYSFLENLSRVQSNRLDDQRCSIKPAKSALKKATNETTTKPADNDDFFNLIMKTQSSRLEDQRSSIALSKDNKIILPNKTGQKKAITVPPDDEFFFMLQKLQSRRLDEQRTNLVTKPVTKKNSKSESSSYALNLIKSNSNKSDNKAKVV